MAGRGPEGGPKGQAKEDDLSPGPGHVRPLESLAVVLFPLVAIGGWGMVFFSDDHWYVSIPLALGLSSMAVHVVRKYGHTWRGMRIGTSSENGGQR